MAVFSVWAVVVSNRTTTDSTLDFIFLIMLLLLGGGAFFMIRFIGFVQKNKKAKRALLSGQKMIVQGTIEVARPDNRRLHYIIDGQTYDVNIIPGGDKRYFGTLYRNLFGITTLQHTPVKMELLKQDEQQYLLLNIFYTEYNTAGNKITAAEPGDFAGGQEMVFSSFYISWAFLFMLFIITPIIGPGPALITTGSMFLPFILGPAILAIFKWRQLKQSDKRWLIEGIVTEVITAREKFTKGGSYTTLYWYRIGSELVCSYKSGNTPDGFNTGDKICAVFQCKENGQIFRLIDILSAAKS
ncbi:hypothetical protein [Niabella ginsenosidivorans]|nr:hypothetical protein [Niabella ginsenosidivorans]